MLKFLKIATVILVIIAAADFLSSYIYAASKGFAAAEEIVAVSEANGGAIEKFAAESLDAKVRLIKTLNLLLSITLWQLVRSKEEGQNAS